MLKAIVHQGEVFKPAIVLSSASLIVVHNHPELLDHVIVGNGGYISLKERG